MNGTMSFVEPEKVANTPWKGCDALTRLVFVNLTDEGWRHYQMRLRECLDGAGRGGGGGHGVVAVIATATSKQM